MDIEKLTAEEKAALISGTDFMYTNPLPKANVPQVRMSDGPHGLRVQTEGGDNGVSGSEPATTFPTAACLASGWNPQNAEKMGEAIAEECLHYGVGILLGPGANIKRNPLCGRNFEYFSEDPLLSGKLAAAQVRGLQKRGVGACVKHFALNNSENYRFMGDSVCDERAMREIYLKSFEIAVKEGQPAAVMCAYNRVNGTFCSENKRLLTDILREEWKFDGAVMTDWGATKDRVKGLRAGLDLEMPGDTPYCRKQILDGIKHNTLEPEFLNAAAKNVLSLAERYGKTQTFTADFRAHNALAAELAADCAILLKNNGALPLNDETNLLVVGELFEKPRYQGAGSSMITPTRLTSPRDAFEKRGAKFDYVRGYDVNRAEPNKTLIAEAVEKAAGYDTVLVFAGLTDAAESEGGDREHMTLPANQLALLVALCDTKKQIIVVLYGGSPVELPFADDVSAILNMYLPGQNGGTATAGLLFGDKTPCGKLAETWVKKYTDVPYGEQLGKSQNEIYYESVFVGYRYYAAHDEAVRFPFGYGLSYTSFSYADMNITETEDGYLVSCEIANTGERDGAEIVQLYVQAPEGVFKPVRELRGFSKVYLKAGEKKRVEIFIPQDELRYWNIKENRFVLESGEYQFLLCRDSEHPELTQTVTVHGEAAAFPYSKTVNARYKAEPKQISPDTWEEMSGLKIPALPPRKPITEESRFTDFRQTFFGRILFRAVLSLAEKQRKQAEKLPEGEEKENRLKGAMFLKRVLESNCVRSMSMTAGSRMPYNFAQGMVHLANGRVLCALGCFCKKIKVPPLPKDQKK